MALLGAVLMGVPMSVVISPLVYAASSSSTTRSTSSCLRRNLLHLAAHLDQNASWIALPQPIRNAFVVIALVLPGSVVMVLAWLGARALFVTGGSEGILRSRRAGAAEGTTGRSSSSGMWSRRWHRRRGEAAAVGSSPDDATIVVGAVGNGDLRTALVVLSMYRAFGLVMTALGATFGPAARRTLLRLIRVGLRRPGRAATAEELHAIDEMLSKTVEMEDGDRDSGSAGKKTTIADVIRLPFLMAYGAFWRARTAFVSFVVGPLIVLLWRARRYLADATAVQLTRNPDGLARALVSLNAKGGVVPGGSWAAPLFVVGPASGSSGAALKGNDFGFVSFSAACVEPAGAVTASGRDGRSASTPRHEPGCARLYGRDRR